MVKEPATIYVLWHPQYAEGQTIATSIFQWFRTPEGHGIPVEYRCEADPGKDSGLPPDIEFSRDRLTIVVILAETQMAKDYRWRRWLGELAEEAKARPAIIYPVALHKTAYKLPGPIRELNFISSLPGKGRGTESSDAPLQEILDGLRTKLTEALARALGNKFKSSTGRKILENIARAVLKAEPARIKIFVSHAKKDGTEVAKALRDYIYQETQLSAFFDENDIALGYRFADVLNDTLESDLAAMIVVNSDVYSSRPWCRREIEIFSKPRVSPINDYVWEKQPVLIVEAMVGDELANGVPEFGNSPVKRWKDGQASLCIDTLLRESIFRSYHTGLANRVERSLKKKSPANRIFLNFKPDAISLMSTILQWEDSMREKHKSKPLRPLEVVYPGSSATSNEILVLDQRFPDVTLRNIREVVYDL